MHPAEKLTRILQVLEANGNLISFNVCRIGILEKMGPATKYTIKNAYYNHDWGLLHAKLEEKGIGDQIYYILRLTFTPKDGQLGNYFNDIRLHLQKGESQLRMYRYYTRSQHHGLTIELVSFQKNFLWLTFYPIESSVLNAMEEAITEEIPVIEVGSEIEVEMQELLSNNRR